MGGSLRLQIRDVGITRLAANTAGGLFLLGAASHLAGTSRLRWPGTKRPVVPDTPLTKANLQIGARRMSYRAQQLVNVANNLGFPSLFEPTLEKIVRNAFIESALAHARVFAYFFGEEPRKEDYHYSYYDSEWNLDRQPPGRIIGSISEHLAHSVIADPQGEGHPGEWPITELAVVLVGAFSEFAEGQDALGQRAWFAPDPAQSYALLMSTNPLARPTVPSAHPDVGELTRELQAYLREQGYLVDADDQ